MAYAKGAYSPDVERPSRPRRPSKPRRPGRKSGYGSKNRRPPRPPRHRRPGWRKPSRPSFEKQTTPSFEPDPKPDTGKGSGKQVPKAKPERPGRIYRPPVGWFARKVVPFMPFVWPSPMGDDPGPTLSQQMAAERDYLEYVAKQLPKPTVWIDAPRSMEVSSDGKTAILELPDRWHLPFIAPVPDELFRPLEEELFLPEASPVSTQVPDISSPPQHLPTGRPVEEAQIVVTVYAPPEAAPGGSSPGSSAGYRVKLQKRIVRRRYDKPKRDRKTRNRVYKRALALINKTWGEADELIDAANALIMNIVNEDGRPALIAEHGDLLAVFEGLADGRYEFDLAGFVKDLVVMELQDRLIGELSHRAQQSLNDAGWLAGQGITAGWAL